jgi:hypothetical protein
MSKNERIWSRDNPNLPGLLDVISLDHQWVQVIMGGNYIMTLSIGKVREVDWRQYRLTKRLNTSIGNLDLHGLSITAQEIENIHWGLEEEEKPSLRYQVTVFGEYESVGKFVTLASLLRGMLGLLKKKK